MREFITPDGDVLVYDFKALCGPQINAAHSIFTLYNERLAHLPETGAQARLFELDNTLCRACAHLLLHRINGVLRPWDVTAAQTEILDMVNSLGSEQWQRLVEVKADFFTRVKLRDGASTTRFAQLLPALVKAYASMPTSSAPESGETSASESRSDSGGSMIPTNPSDG